MREIACVDPYQGLPTGPASSEGGRAFETENAMTRLMMTLFSMIATTLMGVFVVVALTMGHVATQPILIAAALGFVLAIPVSWFVARQIGG